MTDTYFDDPETVRTLSPSELARRQREERQAARGSVLSEPEGPKRSRRQQNEDQILEEAEKLIREGRDLVLEGVDIFSSLQEPQHKNLETVLGQALEQVIQWRQLHR